MYILYNSSKGHSAAIELFFEVQCADKTSVHLLCNILNAQLLEWIIFALLLYFHKQSKYFFYHWYFGHTSKTLVVKL